jgi:hypothetical protein
MSPNAPMARGRSDPKHRRRTSVFLWPTKQHLYEHFEMIYNLSREEVDAAINDAMRDFRLRKGRLVETKELWQKVGMTLKGKLLRH